MGYDYKHYSLSLSISLSLSLSLSCVCMCMCMYICMLKMINVLFLESRERVEWGATAFNLKWSNFRVQRSKDWLINAAPFSDHWKGLCFLAFLLSYHSFCTLFFDSQIDEFAQLPTMMDFFENLHLIWALLLVPIFGFIFLSSKFSPSYIVHCILKWVFVSFFEIFLG